MLCVPIVVAIGSHFRTISYENGGLQVFSCYVCFPVKKVGINSEKCIEYGK